MKVKNKIITAVFLLMLVSFITVLLLPSDKESIEAENRAMAKMPGFSREAALSGEFSSGFESFIDDNIGLRSFLTDLSKDMNSVKGIVPQTGSVISTSKDIGTGTTQKMTLLLADRAIMEMFMKKPESEQLYTDAVNYYADKLPEEIKLFSMLVPTQLEFKEPIYKNLQDSQSDAIKEMYSMLDKRVKAVNVCETLREHSDEYLYFRTDHHWTTLGAYYAYREFMKAEGGSAVNKTDFERNEIRGVLGYLYDRVDRPEIAETPDTIEWYDIDPDGKIIVKTHDSDEKSGLSTFNGLLYDRREADYLFFFGGDHPILEMRNPDLPDGKTIVVIKDSYANVLAPWLIKSYRRVILVDPRMFKDFQTILDTFDIDEVLITNYVFTTNFPDYCKLLKGMYE